jgi:hypothetical protein
MLLDGRVGSILILMDVSITSIVNEEIMLVSTGENRILQVMKTAVMHEFIPFSSISICHVVHRWAFFHAELWAVYGFTVVAMFMIYLTISKQEKSMDQYAFRTSGGLASSDVSNSASCRPSQTRGEDPHRKRSTTFAMQATLYVVVFFFTWFFPMLMTIFSVSRDELYYPLVLLSSILSPLQGFSNAVIYLRPRWIRYRKRYPELSRWQSFLHAIGMNDPEKNSGFLNDSFRTLQRKLNGWSNKSSGAASSSDLISGPPFVVANEQVEVGEKAPQEGMTVSVEEAAVDPHHIEDEEYDSGDEYLD